MQNFVNFRLPIQKILSINEILTLVKGHNSVIFFCNLKHNNPNLYLVNINAYAKFDIAKFRQILKCKHLCEITVLFLN